MTECVGEGVGDEVRRVLCSLRCWIVGLISSQWAPGMCMLAGAGDCVGAVGEGHVLHVIVWGVMTYGECR